MNLKAALLCAAALSSGAAHAGLEGVTPKAPSDGVQREYLEVTFKNACDIGTGRITKEQSRANMQRYVQRLANKGITVAELQYLGQMDRFPSVRKEMIRRYKAGECG